MVEAEYNQYLSSDVHLSELLEKFNILFTAFFTLELFVSAFSHWLVPFLSDPWSWLDVFVVPASAHTCDTAIITEHAIISAILCITRREGISLSPLSIRDGLCAGLGLIAQASKVRNLEICTSIR